MKPFAVQMANIETAMLGRTIAMIIELASKGMRYQGLVSSFSETIIEADDWA